MIYKYTLCLPLLSHFGYLMQISIGFEPECITHLTRSWVEPFLSKPKTSFLKPPKKQHNKQVRLPDFWTWLNLQHGVVVHGVGEWTEPLFVRWVLWFPQFFISSSFTTQSIVIAHASYRKTKLKWSTVLILTNRDAHPTSLTHSLENESNKQMLTIFNNWKHVEELFR